MSDQDVRRLVVGRIVKPHGVRGEFVVEVRTDSPEQRFVPGAVLGVRRGGAARASDPETLTLVAARPHDGRQLVYAEGVEGREAAESLRGALLTVSAEELEPTQDPEEFHDHELEGLRVVLTDGDVVGTVDEVLHSPAGELLQVRTSGGGQVLVPFVSAIVPAVDPDEGRIVVDPPEGLLDEA